MDFAGGLYLFLDGQLENGNDAELHFLGLSSSSFLHNIAGLAGAAMFTNSLDATGVCCDCSLRNETTEFTLKGQRRFVSIMKDRATNLLDNPSPCSEFWLGNVARVAGGDEVATTASIMQLCKVQSDVCLEGGGLLEVMNHTSGEDLEDIDIRLFDIFRRSALGQPKMRVEIRADPRNVSLSGQLSADVTAVTTLTDVRVLGAVNSSQNLSLIFSPNILNDTNIRVHIRDCMPGEITSRDMSRCSLCGQDQYSFLPSTPRQICPINAKCSPSTITPKQGFWHSTSKSDEVHERIIKDVCSYDQRAQDLEEVAQDVHKNMSVLLYNDTRYQQCANVSSNQMIISP